MSLDEYPTRDENKEIQAKAESEFERTVVDCGCFVVQQRDRNDYGTDFEIEAKELASSGMTNVRLHVQLKGTDKNTNQDNSVSISVERTNLNYLLSQPGSVYVCYHRPTGQLLCRSAESVFQELEHASTEWRTQKTVTVRFRSKFDAETQSKIHGQIVAVAKTNRDDRLGWITTPPEQFSIRVAKDVPTIAVPEAPEEALNVLQSLYGQNKDEVISKAFDQFMATIGDGPQLLPAYLSEINLAMRHQDFDRQRVASAVHLLEQYGSDNAPDHVYCLGNAHCALGNREEAKQLFRKAIDLVINSQFSIVAAQSWKNLGSEIEDDGDLEEAQRCYENAIRIEPNLMEAHMALAHVHREAERWEKSLEHLDQVIWAANDVGPTLAARGRRIELNFILGISDRAFEDILSIMTYAEKEDWILPWCARLVFEHARSDDSQINRTIRFWESSLQFRSADRFAARERLLCLAYAKMHGLPTRISYVRFITAL